MASPLPEPLRLAKQTPEIVDRPQQVDNCLVWSAHHIRYTGCPNSALSNEVIQPEPRLDSARGRCPPVNRPKERRKGWPNDEILAKSHFTSAGKERLQPPTVNRCQKTSCKLDRCSIGSTEPFDPEHPSSATETAGQLDRSLQRPTVMGRTSRHYSWFQRRRRLGRGNLGISPDGAAHAAFW